MLRLRLRVRYTGLFLSLPRRRGRLFRGIGRPVMKGIVSLMSGWRFEDGVRD
jgi:hypothetical protein